MRSRRKQKYYVCRYGRHLLSKKMGWLPVLSGYATHKEACTRLDYIKRYIHTEGKGLRVCTSDEMFREQLTW